MFSKSQDEFIVKNQEEIQDLKEYIKNKLSFEIDDNVIDTLGNLIKKEAEIVKTELSPK